MEPDAGAYIRKLLEPDEQLLWSGRPLAEPVHLMGQLLIVFFVLGVTVVAARTGGWFTFVGFGFAAVHEFVDSSKSELDRRNTRYGLSNQRAIILNDGVVRSIPLETLAMLQIDYDLAGRGKILARSSVGEWPHRDDDDNPIRGPLFGVIHSPQHIYSVMIERCPQLAALPSSETATNADQKIREQLRKGEQILWAGRPNPKSVEALTWRDALSVLFIIPYLFIAGAVVSEALETRDPRREGIGAVSDLTLALIIAAAAAFVAFATYAGVLHHVVDSYSRKTTFYGLTDRRLILKTSRFVRYVPLESIASIALETDDDGSGTISCRSKIVGGLDSPPDVRFVRESPFAGPLFRHIDSPDQVIALLITMRPDLQVDAIAANTPDTITPSVMQ